jgi:polyribonucleotide nucleotidyltransferase
MIDEKTFRTEWLGRTLTIKTGKIAKQATSSVTVQYGETVVLATVVESKTEREGIDFFPLMVDFEERLYAAGIIKGSRWIKREGRPSDDAVLTGRMIDRSIRPLFNEESRKDVQVMITVLSVDQENDHDIVSLIAASAALSVSGIDWKGPIGGIRVGLSNGKFIFNPTYEERESSELDLIVSATSEKVIMIEAGGNEIKEDVMLKAILAGQKEQQPIVELIKKMSAEIKITETRPVVVVETRRGASLRSEDEIDAEKEKEKVFDIARDWLNQNVKNILFNKEYYTKGERKAAVSAIKEGLDKYLFEQGIGKDRRAQAVNGLVDITVEAAVTEEILKNKRRVDGRKLNEIRDLYSEVAILPRTHGSSLFSRGETQIMSIVTLGAPGLEQSLEGVEGTGKKRFMHHYNFPPFSVGEARPLRAPGRREIGHGALAEKALLPVIPDKEDFPYTIRIVSETLGSNGSSSMGSTCASSLALMDAGVPIKKAVAGIAMGLASNEDMSEWEVLTDIQDLEDGKGGMDFKIAGTKDGITAIQLDTKTSGLTEEIIKKTLEQGLEARLEILKVMDRAIDKPRGELSPYAPKIVNFYIDPEKIREVIGPGGKVINKIIEATEVTIDIEDDGAVFICGNDPNKLREAAEWVKNIARKFEVGEVFTGPVSRLLDFGAFVELTPGNEGMVHVSELAPYRVESPHAFLAVGDVVTVKIKEIDEQGRINLTMKDLKENEKLWKDEKGKQGGNSNNRRLKFMGDRNRFNHHSGRFNNRGRNRH